MAKQYQVLINEGKGPQNDVVEVTQGAGDQGRSTRLVAQRGVRYELQDLGKGKALAPEHVRLRRIGDDLNLMFDGSQKPDVVLENYYAPTGQTKDAPPPLLAGCVESGDCYEYVPHDPSVSRVTSALKEDSPLVMMSLGGAPLEEGFALSSLAMVGGTAAGGGGVSGLVMAGGALVASLAIGGGGGAANASAPPQKATGALATESDTGYANQDGITQIVTPYYNGKATPGTKVEVLVNGYTYLDTTGPDGSYKVQIKNALPNGTYTPKITVTDLKTGLSTTSDGIPFTVDDSSSVNQPDGVADDNSTATLQITSISNDTGTSASDFITQDNTLIYEGKVNHFISNGDLVKLVLTNAAGAMLNTQYVKPAVTGAWRWDNSTVLQDDGQYTLSASVVDAAGNVVTPSTALVSQVVLISQHSLVAVDDSAVAVEAGMNNPTGTAATGNVLSNDTVLNAADLKRAVAATVTGLYGVLTVTENGDYTYVVNDANTKVNELRGATSKHDADTLTDVFTYQVTDAAGQSASAEIHVTIQGTNDQPKIDGVNSASLSTGAPTSLTGGTLSIFDVDLGESSFQVPAQLNGAYGVFTFSLNGQWTYTLSSDQVFTDMRHDLLVVSSFDGSAFESIDVTINKNVDPRTGVFLDPSQTFSTASTTGLTLFGAATVIDLLLLNSAGLTLDLTASTTNVKSLEKIDLTGTGNNKAILNLDSVLQADAVSGIHKLYVLGNAGDTVQFTGASLGVADTTVSGYNVYHLNNINDLLIQNTVAVVL